MSFFEKIAPQTIAANYNIHMLALLFTHPPYTTTKLEKNSQSISPPEQSAPSLPTTNPLAYYSKPTHSHSPTLTNPQIPHQPLPLALTCIPPPPQQRLLLTHTIRPQQPSTPLRRARRRRRRRIRRHTQPSRRMLSLKLMILSQRF